VVHDAGEHHLAAVQLPVGDERLRRVLDLEVVRVDAVEGDDVALDLDRAAGVLPAGSFGAGTRPCLLIGGRSGRDGSVFAWGAASGGASGSMNLPSPRRCST
jgi:hypothetical protein